MAERLRPPRTLLLRRHPTHLARPGRLAGWAIPSSTFRASWRCRRCGGRPRSSSFVGATSGTLYLAVSVSELGDALNYIALMWFALDARRRRSASSRCGSPTACPRFVFGLHGGIAADRWSRRKLMVGADLVRGATLVPLAVLGLAGSLPLWALVVAAFVLEARDELLRAGLRRRRSRRRRARRTSSGRTRSCRRPRRRSRSAAGRSRPALLSFLPL